MKALTGHLALVEGSELLEGTNGKVDRVRVLAGRASILDGNGYGLI